jgi:hypothetical protein
MVTGFTIQSQQARDNQGHSIQLDGPTRAGCQRWSCKSGEFLGILCPLRWFNFVLFPTLAAVRIFLMLEFYGYSKNPSGLPHPAVRSGEEAHYLF